MTTEIKVSRETLIQYFVATCSARIDVVEEAFRTGWRGYENLTDEELENEWLLFSFRNVTDDLQEIQEFLTPEQISQLQGCTGELILKIKGE